MKPEILERVQGCLMGALLGDALGMPVEMMNHGEIIHVTDGRGVTGFDSFEKIGRRRLREHAVGDWTDDWQLTAAIARSIIARKGYDFLACALAQLEEFRKSTFGWGGTTKDSFREIDEFFTSFGMRGRNPFTPAQSSSPGRGSGNGVAMKVMPLALLGLSSNGYGFLQDPGREGEAVHLFKDFGYLTHSDPRAGTAAFAMAAAISLILKPLFWPSDFPKNFLKNLRDRVWSYEVHNGYHFPANQERLFSHYLVELPDLPQNVSAFAPDSVQFAINVFLRYMNDFRAGVLAAVNAGGDTDTTGSLTGALIGARVGIQGIPEEWRNFRPEYQEALTLGQQLYDVCSR